MQPPFLVRSTIAVVGFEPSQQERLRWTAAVYPEIPPRDGEHVSLQAFPVAILRPFGPPGVRDTASGGLS